MKNTILLICLSALLLPSALMATDGPPPFHKGPNEAVRKYIKEQIMPVLLQKRAQFDRELTDQEKNEIAVCPTALKQLRAQHHDWKPEGNSDNVPSPDNGSDMQKRAPVKDGNHPGFEQHKAIFERLQAIAAKHSNSLQDIKMQLEPARKQWLADMKKLQPVEESAKAENQLNGDKHMGHGPGNFPFAHHMQAVHFLLLSANTEDQSPEELQGDLNEPAGISDISANKFTSFNVLPNPATNDLQLGTDIIPATNQLKIVDVQGNEVMNLENVQAAQHLDVSKLAGGTYLVQIKSGDQLVSKKIVITR